MIDLQGPVQPGGGGERLWENLLGLKGIMTYYFEVIQHRNPK